MTQSFQSVPFKHHEELISYLYGEMDDEQLAAFQEHLSTCDLCNSEAASFGAIRGSINAWKQQALKGFASNVELMPVPTKTKSASAALREFFHLSPLWMKGAVAFSAVLFCLFAVLAFVRSSQPGKNVAKTNSDAVYTKQDLENAVSTALQKNSTPPSTSNEQEVVAGASQTPKKLSNQSRIRSRLEVGSRRPLTKAEREQLAADLRLTNTGDENNVELLGERINY